MQPPTCRAARLVVRERKHPALPRCGADPASPGRGTRAGQCASDGCYALPAWHAGAITPGASLCKQHALHSKSCAVGQAAMLAYAHAWQVPARDTREHDKGYL